MSAEDPAASRARMSPSHQRNGHEERTGSVSRTEETRSPTRQTHPEHLNTGPASRAAKGGSFSIPYIDCSDVDAQYYLGRDQASRSDHSYREQGMLPRGSGSGGINGALQAQQEHFLGRMYRESSSSSRASLIMSHELEHSPKQSCQTVDRSPVHSIIGDIGVQERQSNSPITVSTVTGSRGVTASPVIDILHHAPSLSRIDQNGYSPTPLNFNDGRCSPVMGRSPCSQKFHKVHFDADAVQGTSSAKQESRTVLSRAERMAALERRMVANGLTAPGRSRTSLGQKRLRSTGVTQYGAVQMNDGPNTSGSESSESELENNRGNCSSPVMFGSPAEANSSSPIPRNTFSFGSLQLDEEADEDASHAFSDEDIGHIFSC